MIRLEAPLDPEKIPSLRAGDKVLITGKVYTARDAAHKRLTALLDRGEPLPFGLANAVVYYCGPAPTPPGEASGSAGPTTSYRMDVYAPRLLSSGLRGMIGKGKRSQAVVEAIVKTRSVYFGAPGGAGALLAARIRSSTLIAFEDLGPEAVRELYVEDFPATVVIDCLGNDLYSCVIPSSQRNSGPVCPASPPW